MQLDELTREGARVMSVCNACRYCEQYCPVFQAMEQRVTFASADMNYLANLCHNCGECLYACQYAPPHEFAINVPKTLAQIRVRSYEQYTWPAALATAFRHHGVNTALLLVGVLIAVMLAAALGVNGDAVLRPGRTRRLLCRDAARRDGRAVRRRRLVRGRRFVDRRGALPARHSIDGCGVRARPP